MVSTTNHAWKVIFAKKVNILIKKTKIFYLKHVFKTFVTSSCQIIYIFKLAACFTKKKKEKFPTLQNLIFWQTTKVNK